MKIIVIGGGISGITAAISAKSNNNEVIILEKNKTCLKKALITGNGHCNYFNDDFSYLNYYSKDEELLKEIITDDAKKLLINFYNGIGLVPRIKNGYYYPYSNQAYAFYNALMKEASIKGIKIINEVNVLNIVHENKFIIKTDKEEFVADKVIIATGSKAYPKTGSTGDGYEFLKELNHTVNDVYPALVSLNTDSKVVKELDGIRNDAKVTLLKDNETINNEFGELQFTKTGLSGICIYNLSLPVNQLLKNHKISVLINFLAGLNINTNLDLKKYLEDKNSMLKGRTIMEILEEVINYNIVNAIFKKNKIASDIKLDNISLSDLDNLINDVISLKVDITGTKDFDASQVCSGGLSLNDININTFESKKIPNLYIVGELIDITGKCGGYNISFAVLSGIKAGVSCA